MTDEGFETLQDEIDYLVNFLKTVQDDYDNLWSDYSELLKEKDKFDTEIKHYVEDYLQSLSEYEAVKLEFNTYVTSVEQELAKSRKDIKKFQAENEKLKAGSSSGQEEMLIAENKKLKNIIEDLKAGTAGTVVKLGDHQPASGLPQSTQHELYQLMYEIAALKIEVDAANDDFKQGIPTSKDLRLRIYETKDKVLNMLYLLDTPATSVNCFNIPKKESGSSLVKKRKS